MNAPRGSRIVQTAVRSYLVLLFLSLVATGLLLTRTGRNWGLGDWLINYQGGFVRRGLAGQLCLLLGNATHLSPIDIAAAAGIACYALLFFSVWQLLRYVTWRWWGVALLVSPATLAFPAISRASFRKEILFLALLAALVVWLRQANPGRRDDLFLSAGLSLALPAIVLSHEPLVAYFPYLAAAVFISLERPSRVATILALPVLLTALATAAVLAHQGDPETVAKICASVGEPSVANCSTAIQGLAQTRPQAIASVASTTYRFHYYRNYSIALILGLIPILAAALAFRRQPASWHSLRIVVYSACVSVPLSVGLFRYGVDWGRWIYIHLLSLALLTLLIDSQEPQPPSPETATPRAEAALRWPMLVFLVLYGTCWSLPGVLDKPRFGYLSLAQRLVHWNGSLTN